MITNTRLDVVDNGIFLDELLTIEYKDKSSIISEELYNQIYATFVEMYQVGEGALGDFRFEEIAKLVYEKRCDTKFKLHYNFETIEDFARYERFIFNRIKEEFNSIEDPDMIIENIDSVTQFKTSVFVRGFRSECGKFNVGISYTGDKVTNSKEDTVDVIIFTPYWYVLDIYPVPISQIKDYINEMVLKYINEE